MADIAPFETFAASAHLEGMKPAQWVRAQEFYKRAGELATEHRIDLSEESPAESWYSHRRVMAILGGRIAVHHTTSSCQVHVDFPAYSHIGKPGDSRLVTVRRTYAMGSNVASRSPDYTPLSQYDTYGNIAPAQSNSRLWSDMLLAVPSLHVVDGDQGPVSIRHQIAMYDVSQHTAESDGPHSQYFEYYDPNADPSEAMGTVFFSAAKNAMRSSLRNPYGERMLSMTDYRGADHSWLMLIMRSADL